MAVTNYPGLSQRTTAWAATEMLKHAEPVLVLSKFGQIKPLPKNKADNVTFRRPNPFAVTTTPLTEGVTPTAQALTYTDVNVQVQQYGQLVEITDKVEDMAEDPVLKDAATLVGEQAAETVELVTHGAIKAGTNVRYSNGVARNAVNTPIALADVRSAVRTLQRNRGKPVTKILGGGVNINTTPIEASYIALGHTDLEADIRALPGFTPVAQYGSRKPVCDYEVGSVENVRFVLSPVLGAWADAGGVAGGTVLSTTGTNADVYPLIVIAQDAYGCVPLKGESAITPTVVSPDQVTKSDPLGQRGYVGAKTYHAGVILNQAWMVRIECAASVL